MTEDITITERDGILRAKVSGERTADTIRKGWVRVGTECSSRNIKGVLWESHLTGAVSDTDLFEIAQQLRAYGISDQKIALVHVEKASFATSVFGTTVAQNRGIAIKLFAEVESAEKWLSDVITEIE